MTLYKYVEVITWCVYAQKVGKIFEQQRKGKLEPFYIDMPISLSKGDITKIKSNIKK